LALFGFSSLSQLSCHRSVLLRCFVVALGGVAVALGSFAVAWSKSVDARVVGGFLVNLRGAFVDECGFVKAVGGAETCLPSRFPHFVGRASGELGGTVALPHGSRRYAATTLRDAGFPMANGRHLSVGICQSKLAATIARGRQGCP
jgi:hypothetical protein